MSARKAPLALSAAGLSGAAVACLVLFAPPLTAAPKRVKPDKEQASRFRTAVRADADDLEGLEKAVRECGFGPSVRRRDEAGEWLDVELPLERDSAGRLRCIADWMHGKPGVDLGMFTEPRIPAEAIGRVPDHAPPEPGESAFAVAGPAPAIDRLEKVARKCGFVRIERKPMERGRMLLLARDVDWDAKPRDPKLTCAYDWMNSHPLEALELVIRTPGP